MKSYILLMLFSSICFIGLRRKLSLVPTSVLSAVLASLLFQAFAGLVDGYQDPLWLVGLLVGTLFCLAWCGILALIDMNVRKR